MEGSALACHRPSGCTQFTCFTRTKVRILTAALWPVIDLFQCLLHDCTQFTCFTRTKVRILTAALWPAIDLFQCLLHELALLSGIARALLSRYTQFTCFTSTKALSLLALLVQKYESALLSGIVRARCSAGICPLKRSARAARTSMYLEHTPTPLCICIPYQRAIAPLPAGVCRHMYSSVSSALIPLCIIYTVR